MRFLRLSFFFSSIPLSYSSVPISVAGVLGIVLGVAALLHRLRSSFGRLVTEPVQPRRTLMGCPGVAAGVTGTDAGDCGEIVSSLGDGGCVTVGDVGREEKYELCGRESDFSLAFALGMLLSSEYLSDG